MSTLQQTRVGELNNAFNSTDYLRAGDVGSSLQRAASVIGEISNSLYKKRDQEIENANSLALTREIINSSKAIGDDLEIRYEKIKNMSPQQVTDQLSAVYDSGVRNTSKKLIDAGFDPTKVQETEFQLLKGKEGLLQTYKKKVTEQALANIKITAEEIYNSNEIAAVNDWASIGFIIERFENVMRAIQESSGGLIDKKTFDAYTEASVDKLISTAIKGATSNGQITDATEILEQYKDRMSASEQVQLRIAIQDRKKALEREAESNYYDTLQVAVEKSRNGESLDPKILLQLKMFADNSGSQKNKHAYDQTMAVVSGNISGHIAFKNILNQDDPQQGLIDLILDLADKYQSSSGYEVVKLETLESKVKDLWGRFLAGTLDARTTDEQNAIAQAYNAAGLGVLINISPKLQNSIYEIAQQSGSPLQVINALNSLEQYRERPGQVLDSLISGAPEGAKQRLMIAGIINGVPEDKLTRIQDFVIKTYDGSHEKKVKFNISESRFNRAKREILEKLDEYSPYMTSREKMDRLKLFEAYVAGSFSNESITEQRITVSEIEDLIEPFLTGSSPVVMINKTPTGVPVGVTQEEAQAKFDQWFNSDKRTAIPELTNITKAEFEKRYRFIFFNGEYGVFKKLYLKGEAVLALGKVEFE